MPLGISRITAALANSPTFRYRAAASGVEKALQLADMLPTKTTDNKWKRPVLSRLKIARARREVLDSGVEWPFDVAVNNKPVVFKGQKHLMTQAKRFDAIEKAMKEMPAKLEEYYKNLRTRRARPTDPVYVINHGFGRMK